MRTSHFTSPATKPAESSPVPILFMKSARPERCISSSKRIARRSPITPLARIDDTNQPIATMMMKPRMRGIALRIIENASRKDPINVWVKDGPVATGTV